MRGRAALMFSLLAACTGSSDPEAEPAHGVDPTVVAPPAAPIEPAEPATPVLTPCPTGWTEQHDPDARVVTCAPWPEAEPAPCEDGFARVPGDAACAPVGAACPLGEWPEDLPEAGVLFVRAGAAGGGDGTADRPYASIAEALVAARAGATVAVAKGTYDEPVLLPAGVTLAGACAKSTRIESSTPADRQGVVTPLGLRTVLRDVTISGARPGLWITADRALRVEGVIIDRATMLGAAVGGGRLEGRDFVVRDTAPSIAGIGGRGIDVEVHGAVELARVTLERNHEEALFAASNATVHVTDAVLRETSASVGVATSNAVLAQGGAMVELERAVVEHNAGLGVAAVDGAVIDVEDVVVRDTRAISPRDGGGALSAQLTGTLRARRVSIAASTTTAVHAGHAGVVDIADVVIDGPTGNGVYAFDGSSVTGARVLVRDIVGAAVTATESTSVSLSDVTIVAPKPFVDTSQAGFALQAALGSLIAVERGRVDGYTDAAVFVRGDGAAITITDMRIADGLGRPADGYGGVGIVADEGARVEATRVSIDRAQEAGVAAGGAGTTLRLVDLIVRDTRSREIDGYLGRGVTIEQGAVATLERARIEASHEGGLICLGASARCTAYDVTIDETAPSTCAETRGCTGAGGSGLAAVDASLDATRFAISHSALAGVQLARGGDAHLVDGLVSYNAIGINLQGDDLELESLIEHVAFVGNDRTIDSRLAPVPQPGLGR